MKNKTTQEQLIELYEQQIQDLVMMSKIELGDDVIAKIKELKSQIHKQQTAVEWLINAVEANMDDIPLEVQEQAKELENQQKQNYLKEYFAWHNSMGFVSHTHEDIIEFNKTYGGAK